MRHRRSIGRVAAVLAITAVISIRPSAAQVAAHVDGDPVARALDAFSKRTGISVVYADRVVSGRIADCNQEGLNPHPALDCILEGTGLEARWTRDDQVVIVTSRPVRLGTIEGSVIDSDTGEPIPGAHVLLADGPVGVVTNEDGWYRLTDVAEGDVNLTISHLGYESRRISTHIDTDPPLIRLEPRTIAGTAVVVEGSRSTIDDIVSANVSAGAEGVGAYRFSTDYGNLLVGPKPLPAVSRTGEISGQFVVRGGLPDQNVFKLDGAPVYQPWHSQGLFSILQPETVDNLRLFTGPLPADQGGYLASVLDAELSPGTQHTTGTASITSTVGEMTVSTPLSSGVTALIAGRHSHAGLARTYSLSLPNSQTIEGGSFYDLVAKVGVRSSPNNWFSVTAYRGFDDLSWTNSNSRRTSDASAQEWANGVYSMRHRYLASDRLLVTNSVYVSTFDAVTQNEEERVGNQFPDDSQHIRDAGMKIDVDYRASAHHELKIGIEFAQHHLEWTDRRRTGYYLDEVMEGALFAHDTWSIIDRLTVRPGLRLSWFGNGIGMQAEPRFHALLNVSGATSLHASWAHQVQYLHQVSDISSGLSGQTVRRWMISSDNSVAPATGNQFNLGVTSQAGPRWTLSADLYWRDYENVFLPRSTLAYGHPYTVSTYNETEGFSDFEQGSTSAYGLELSAQYQNRWFMFSSSYTGSRSLFRVPSQHASEGYKPGVYDTPHMVRASTGYLGSKLSLVISAEARSGYPTIAAVRGTAEQIGDDRLPTYFRLDAAVGYRFETLGFDWEIQGRVYNLTDRENVIGYEYDRDLLYLRRNSLFGVTRWPTLNLKVSW
ncbi:MAG: carboxypeptidase-like regulatory domain-containing protein [Candidatus Latescibacterota bacterium]|jgi:hypothetical protein